MDKSAFWNLITDGGPVFWVILFCGMIAMVIFIKKTLQFHREEFNVKEFLMGIKNVFAKTDKDTDETIIRVTEKEYVEACALCDNQDGPVSKIVSAAILAHKRKDDNLQQAIDDVCLEELPKLEKDLDILGTIGYIAPLLGLLGTVLGMMGVFMQVEGAESFGNLSVNTELAGDIREALITTAGGLCVAIPCYVAYNYLVARVNSITLDMEKAASEIIFFFEQIKQSNKEASAKIQENKNEDK